MLIVIILNLYPQAPKFSLKRYTLLQFYSLFSKFFLAREKVSQSLLQCLILMVCGCLYVKSPRQVSDEHICMLLKTQTVLEGCYMLAKACFETILLGASEPSFQQSFQYIFSIIDNICIHFKFESIILSDNETSKFFFDRKSLPKSPSGSAVYRLL